MKLIDLHIHSTASDGSLTPTEVVNRANDLGLTAMALTDHDTVAGIDEALEAAKDLNMEVIPGIEVSCIYKGKEIHILGLYIDHKDPKLLSFLKEASRKRYDRNMEMLAAFNKDGFEITEEDLLCGNPGTVIWLLMVSHLPEKSFAETIQIRLSQEHILPMLLLPKASVPIQTRLLKNI